MPYTQTYGERAPLFLCALTADQHARTCGYWYTVTDRGMAHTAFRTREALLQWLDLNGLRLERELPAERGTHDVQRILGSYRTCSYLPAASQS